METTGRNPLAGYRGRLPQVSGTTDGAHGAAGRRLVWMRSNGHNGRHIRCLLRLLAPFPGSTTDWLDWFIGVVRVVLRIVTEPEIHHCLTPHPADATGSTRSTGHRVP